MKPLLQSLRPRQWLKNVVVFAPLVFAVAFFSTGALEKSIVAFVALCFLSSAVYLVNDVQDRKEDQRHPTKRDRPIASGALSVSLAWLVAGILVLLGLGLSFLLSPLTLLASLGFLIINAWYSFGGKRVPILDVMLIGGSFVVRVLVGAAAIGVTASMWLLLTLFFLATYLGFSKRAGELRLAPNGSRPSLEGYQMVFLDHARSATLAVTLALYTLYTFSSPLGQTMALTVPFVFFGLMRYQAIADSDRGMNDGPTEHLYKDRQLQIAVLLWGLAVLVVVALQG